MNKQMRLSAVGMIIAMSLKGMKHDKKENVSPQALIDIIKRQHNPSDDIVQFAEGMFEYIQKNNPEMYKNLAGGIYSQQK